MSETQPPRRIGRSIGAMLAGVVVGALLSAGTDAVLQKTGVFPTSNQPMGDMLLLLATAYRTVYGIAGSYVTARLAPNRPMQHALALGALGSAIGIVGVVMTWGQPTVVGHEWYPIALTVLALPQSWLGAVLYRPALEVRDARKDTDSSGCDAA